MQNGIHLLLTLGDLVNFFTKGLAKKMNERLFNFPEILHGHQKLAVPVVMITHRIVRVYGFSPDAFFGLGFKGFFYIQVTIVVSKFFAGINITDSNFKFISGGEAIGIGAMVYKTRIVPAENVVAFGVSVSIFIEHLLI